MDKLEKLLVSNGYKDFIFHLGENTIGIVLNDETGQIVIIQEIIEGEYDTEEIKSTKFSKGTFLVSIIEFANSAEFYTINNDFPKIYNQKNLDFNTLIDELSDYDIILEPEGDK